MYEMATCRSNMKLIYIVLKYTNTQIRKVPTLSYSCVKSSNSKKDFRCYKMSMSNSKSFRKHCNSNYMANQSVSPPKGLYRQTVVLVELIERILVGLENFVYFISRVLVISEKKKLFLLLY